MKISNEEKLLIKVLFKDEILKKEDLINVDLDKLIFLLSSHLIIPSFYYNLKKSKSDKFFNNEFIEYIKKIYEINKDRNKQMVIECNEINEILKSNNIEFVFLKGVALIDLKIFEDLGERMIGDIDVLVNRNQIKKVIRILRDKNYISKYDYKTFDYVHTPKKINKKKLFAVEPHIKLFNSESIISANQILKKRQCIHNINTPNKKDTLIHNILNYQINDNGSVLLNYSFRSLYDTFKLLKFTSINEKYMKNNLISKYFFISEKLDINLLKYKKFNSGLLSFLFYIKTNYRLLFNVFAKLIIIYNKTSLIRFQLIELVSNKNYRKHVINKILNISTQNKK